MTDRKFEWMHRYLQTRRAECDVRRGALQAEGRGDEAVFQQIRGNVFALARDVLNAAEKQKTPAEFFLQKMTQIPSAWLRAREAALAHGDEAAAHLEKIKLDAAEELLYAFRKGAEELS